MQKSNIECSELTSSDLFKLLVLNGYIDENYQIYTSIFYEGRLSKRDNGFLRTVHTYQRPEIDYSLDNPKEVITNMKKEYFGQNYVLNISLVDYLFGAGDQYNEYKLEAASFVTRNVGEASEFLNSYLTNGEHIDEFLFAVCDYSPEFIEDVTTVNDAPNWIPLVFKALRKDKITEDVNSNGFLTEYLSKNRHGFCSDYKFTHRDLSLLVDLDVKFIDLASLESNRNLVEFALKKNLYDINKTNIGFIVLFLQQKQKTDLRTVSFSAVLATKNQTFISYLEANIDLYLNKVFFPLEVNNNENETAIVRLLENPAVSLDVGKTIISHQEFICEDIGLFGQKFWSQLLEENKIFPSWGNVGKMIESDKIENQSLSSFLGQPSVIDQITVEALDETNLTSEIYDEIASLIFGQTLLSKDNFSKLVLSLNRKFSEFPDNTEDDQDRTLLELDKIELNQETFEHHGENPQLTAMLIENNLSDFLRDQDSYSLSEELKFALLDYEVGHELQTKIVEDADDAFLNIASNAPQKLSDFYLDNDFSSERVNKEVLNLAISKSTNLGFKIGIINKYYTIWNVNEMSSLLSHFPHEYQQIGIKGKQPKLRHSPENILLAENLMDMGLVNSISSPFLGFFRVYTKKKW